MMATVDTTSLPSRFGAELPAWVAQELDPLPDRLSTDEDRMAVVNTLAARNYREGSGGPFAALVVERESGRLISAGVNLVLSSGLSSAHAEVVALSLAQTRLGRWDLGAADVVEHDLVVNWRPCAMCYGALLWSGVRRLVAAGDGPELEQLTGFDEGPVRDDWDDQLIRRGLSVTVGVLRDEALAVFAAYGEYTAATGAVVYNARGAK
jgi:tRNA(Arg) A34 adenosine deaminase TadA